MYRSLPRREPLDIDGERALRTSSLNLDDDGPAVTLFRLRVEQAGAVLDPARDTAAIVRICRRLDGIPLAIELAAARARSLRPVEIADRLDDMFRLLTGGRRGSVERHRTLRAALDWSHDLLPDSQQVLLAWAVDLHRLVPARRGEPARRPEAPSATSSGVNRRSLRRRRRGVLP